MLRCLTPSMLSTAEWKTDPMKDTACNSTKSPLHHLNFYLGTLELYALRCYEWY